MVTFVNASDSSNSWPLGLCPQRAYSSVSASGRQLPVMEPVLVWNFIVADAHKLRRCFEASIYTNTWDAQD